MIRKDIFSVCLVSIYLLIYIELLQFDNTQKYGIIMFLFSPFLICWMVYTVLKHGKYKGRELNDDEFGYQDKSTDELGVF
ncbi:MAG: hypothetical protein ABIN36_15110 [Ferruginibacter sp.]